jgi:polyphosphate kinase
MPGLSALPPFEAWLKSERYFNRELSWLLFNRRVLEEAANPDNPLLERVKFLAIFESNLDEFYMVRVSGLIEQHESHVSELTPDGLTAHDQLAMIAETAHPLRRQAGELWLNELRPALAHEGISVVRYDELDDRRRAEADAFFVREIFPVCTPLVLEPAPNLPFISNRSLNIGVRLSDPREGARLGRVKVPTVHPRLIPLGKPGDCFVLIEELIVANLATLFPGVRIDGANLFRVVRDADIEIRELEASDLVDTIEKTIHLRRFGDPVLLQLAEGCPRPIRESLRRLHNLDNADVMEVPGPLGLEMLWELASIDRPDLRFPHHTPHVDERLAETSSLFAAIAERDVLVHHPFDGFLPVQEFVAAAETDPNVIGIKQTLYRVGAESPIVEALLDAAHEGKQVAVMVELKARFDESNNLVWARALERAGVHVAYGFATLKVHCKLCLIVRREADGIRRYAHIGTGNYNPTTAKIYTDLGLFTVDPDITQDIGELFNFLTGFSKQTDYRKLLVAPLNLREGIVEAIERETRLHRECGGGRIVFKLNSLVDPEVIDALYEASQAGVDIDLIVRGICCLRPGVQGMSENIRVRSIVGRFLEHSRVYYFANAGEPRAWIGSADLMRRNLDRRVEVLVPVEDPRLREHLRDVILDSYLRDNRNAWSLGADGVYRRLSPGDDPPFSAQEHLMQRPTSSLLFAKPSSRRKRG